MVGQYFVSFTAGQMGKEGFQSCRAVTPGQHSSEGVPQERKIWREGGREGEYTLQHKTHRRQIGKEKGKEGGREELTLNNWSISESP